VVWLCSEKAEINPEESVFPVWGSGHRVDPNNFQMIYPLSYKRWEASFSGNSSTLHKTFEIKFP
jgi:hypothetical protein